MNIDKKYGWFLVTIQFIFIGLFFLVIYIETHFKSVASTGLKTSGLVLCIISLIVLIWAIRSFRQPISPNPVPPESTTLVTRGIYSKIRHPIYLSVIIAFLGICIYYSVFFPFLIWIVSIFFLIYKISKEETYLIKKFPEYNQYRQKSWKLIPYLF